jgi:hypothetical protein
MGRTRMQRRAAEALGSRLRGDHALVTITGEDGGMVDTALPAGLTRRIALRHQRRRSRSAWNAALRKDNVHASARLS